ncbi:energy transducer TonB [soil metagenome]
MTPESSRPAICRDRLFTTLFLAAMLHGIVIMGVTFSAGSDTNYAQAFEVLLVRSTPREQPPDDEADYLAERSQAGAGNSVEARFASSAPTTPVSAEQPGLETGNAPENALPGRESRAAELVVSRAADNPAVESTRDPTEQAAEEPRLARELVARDEPADPAAEADDAIRIRGDRLRELYVTGRTRQSRLAPYLDRWKRKVEQIGTLNFPDQARRQRLSGSPTLEVAIRADGSLDAIVLRRSSGEKLLDQASLRILRLAAPFDPFPEDIRGDYDVLRFVYEWQFIGGEVHDSAVRLPEETSGDMPD